MTNSTFEHAVATVHNVNGNPVTTDTNIDFLDAYATGNGDPGTRAHDFNVALLNDDDFFSFSPFLNFELEDSTCSTDTFFSSPYTEDES